MKRRRGRRKKIQRTKLKRKEIYSRNILDFPLTPLYQYDKGVFRGVYKCVFPD